jgi:hypothetical protein
MSMFGVRTGEDFLSAKFQEVSQFGNISFAYLDNYDWIWAVGLHALPHAYVTVLCPCTYT